MLVIRSGLCILDLLKIGRQVCWEHWRCMTSGTGKPKGGSRYGLARERREGRSQPSSPLLLSTDHTLRRVSEGLYKEMAAISNEKNIPITMHCAEAPADKVFFASQAHTAMSYCESVDLLGPQTVLVHMVHLEDTDIAKLAATGTHIVHCPSSNTKLASGICRVPDLLTAGVSVSLGTDGAPCNNTCDMLQEMRMAGILHKVSRMDPTSVPAETVLEAATINGAKALGLADSILQSC